MSFKLGLCYCQIDKIKTWQVLSEHLAKILGTPVCLEISSNLIEELEKIRKEEFDLYYASFPISVYELYKKGYVPIAKFKNDIPKYILISNKEIEDIKAKGKIKIAILDHPTFTGLFLILKLQFDLDFFNFLIVKFNSYDEIIEKVSNKEVDIGIIPDLKHFKLQTGNFVKKELIKKSYHYFMIKRNFSDIDLIKQALNTINKKILKSLEAEKIEFISFWERHNILAYCFISDYMSDFFEKSFISKIILESPYLGIAIYDNFYVYANDYLCSLLKYTPEEFKTLKPEEILYYEEDRIKAREIVKKRLKGEFFILNYNIITLKTKDNQKVEALLYTATIFYKGKYAGLVLLIDVTKQQRLERLNRVLKEVNRVLITSNYEKEIYEKVIPVLLEGLQLKGICIGLIDETKKVIRPVFCFPEKLKQKGEVSLDKDHYWCVRAYKTNKIQIITDVQKDVNIKLNQDLVSKIGIKSLCSIPLTKNNKIVSVLTLLSEENQFFREDCKEIIQELQRDLSFALTKVDLLLKNLIINEFIQKTEDILIIADISGKIEYINPSGIKILELKEEDQFKTCFDLLAFPKNIIENLKNKKLKEIKRIGTYSKKGKKLILDLKISYIELSKDVQKIIILGKDLSKEVAFEKERIKLRNYDLLTGLLNYQGFTQKVSKLLTILKKKGMLIILDIYNFSYINHFYGTEIGDICLKEIANKLKEVVGKNGIVGRPVGDEFSIFIVDVDKDQYSEWINKIVNIFSEPLQIKNKKLFLEFNASIVIYPDDGTDFKELWQKSNILLNEIKRKGPNIVEFFNPAVEIEVKKIFTTIGLVKKAIKEHLFIFYYQPYFETQSLKIAGLEALVRIKDGERIVKPAEFIEYLENSPYIKDFEFFSFYKNLNKAKQWQIPISINVSSKSFEFLHILEIVSKYENLIKDFSDYLIIEITEHTLAKNLKVSQKVLNILKSYNLKVALDDFGTGYSSLNYLKNFPIDIIKIDKSFIDLILMDKKTYYIVETIIKLAKNLGIKTLAEGVETEEQLKILQGLDCDLVQGFLLSKPLPEEEIEEIIYRHKNK